MARRAVLSHRRGFTLESPLEGHYGGPNAKAIAREAEEFIRRALIKEISTFYEATLDAIDRFLLNPKARRLGGVNSTPRTAYARGQFSHPIKIKAARGSIMGSNIYSGKARNPRPWKELRENYRYSRPISTTFWRKQGKLRNEIEAQLYSGGTRPKVKEYKLGPASAKSGIRGPSRVRKAITLKTRIGMPKLQPPFDQMITGPFVKASHLVAGDFDLKGSDPKGFARIAFVEGNRPIIAAIAAEGGRLLREHLNSQAGGGLSTKSVFR